MDGEKAGIQISKKAFITSLIILFVLMMIAGILTKIIPSGAYERELVDGVETLKNGTFAYDTMVDYPIWRWFIAPLEVLFSSDNIMVISIILFIFIIGGVFAILDKSGLLRYIMGGLVKRFSNGKYQLMAAFILFFMIFGSVFGIMEEVVPLVPIVVILSYAMGWDSLTGLGMSALAAGYGFSVATLNPFTLGVAQRLAGLPLFSGLIFRILCFILFYFILYTFLRRYAKSIEKNPEKSKVYEEDLPKKELYSGSLTMEDLPNKAHLGKAVKVFSLFLLVVIIYITLGFLFKSLAAYSMPVMAVLFLIGGLVAAKVSRYEGKVGKDFLLGVTGIAPGGILILMAMSVKLIITEGGIMDTILYFAAEKISSMGPYGGIVLTFLLVLILNFFVASGSAKAFLLIPIIAPLTDLIGITRQMAVQAFCFGDGFTNLIYPTNAFLMISLGVTVVGYTKWLKWIIPLQLLVLVINIGLLLLAVAIKYGPY